MDAGHRTTGPQDHRTTGETETETDKVTFEDRSSLRLGRYSAVPIPFICRIAYMFIQLDLRVVYQGFYHRIILLSAERES